MPLANLGGNAEKDEYIYDGEYYIVKFGEKIPPDSKRPLQGSYNNAPFSEWLGSHVFQALGIDAHDTKLGTFNGRTVVACKDFVKNREDGYLFELLQFENLERNIVSSSERGSTPILKNLQTVFETHPDLEPVRTEAVNRYWDMMVVDAIIGNFDRHGGNWGYIANRRDGMLVELAPCMIAVLRLHHGFQKKRWKKSSKTKTL